MTALCPHCAAIAAANIDAIARRVKVWPDSWAGSPAPYLGGDWGDVDALRAAGLAERTHAGWYIPTPAFLARYA